ncbi:conserved phage C-terminal domain-containing protein, partial [Candidatus Bipolaricaulota bacterium]|nr:conserved phage C-terminal domain-containing protein [Candidatus Bipolaricaulota bacterium]
SNPSERRGEMVKIRLASDPHRHLVVEKSMLEDPRLSFRAKGLLAYLLAHPDFDLSNKRMLASVSLEGVDALQTALKELEEAGYFRTAQEANEDGSVQEVGVVSPVSRIPLLETLPIEKSRTKPTEGIAPSGDSKNLDTPAQRVIDQLNSLRRTAWDWARYTPISAKYAKNVEHINGRLADGYTEADLILVLEYLAAADGGKEESRKYFDCVTPFNTKNFERNVAMARDWDAKARPSTPFELSFQRSPGHDAEIYEKRLTGGRQ